MLVMLDLSAAFDVIDHHILFRRLENTYGIAGSALSWIKSYLKLMRTPLRGMGRHSWKCSRFKRTQMKIIHKYNLVHNFDFICFPYK